MRQIQFRQNSPMRRMDVPVSICRNCDKACGKCSWSAIFMPVKGWDAEPTKINISGRRAIDSFLVKSCPLFRADDARHTKTIRTDRVKPFGLALLVSAIRDYATATIKIERCRLTGKSPVKYARYLSTASQTEWWFNSPLGTDILDACGIKTDPNVLLQAIRSDPEGVLNRIKQQYHVDVVDDEEDDN